MTRSDARVPVVDFGRTARRLRRSAVALGVLTLIAWPIVGWLGGSGLAPRVLGELVGWSVLAAIVLEIVIVGGSALRGMLRAGERGDRLASSDVALIPPQLLRRLRSRSRR